MSKNFYILPEESYGYPAGFPLLDVPLREARALECNRCGDCCNGLSDGVTKDEATGLPKFVWGSNAPDDLYEERFGKKLLQPIVMGDGGIELGDAFEIDADGKPYTAFQCSMWRAPEEEGGCSSCALYGMDTNPNDLSTIRPRNCGEFPVFGLIIDTEIIDGHPCILPTAALPRCTWYGIRVVGPWKNEDAWRERWEKQQELREQPTSASPVS